MAMIVCSECGNQISNKAEKCVHCGNPIRLQKNRNVNWGSPKPKLGNPKLNQNTKSSTNKNILISLIIIVVVVAFINSLSNNSEKDEKAQSSGFSRSTTESTVNDVTATEEFELPDEADIIDVDYVYMWENYSDDEFKDKWVRITGIISSVDSKNANISDGLSGLTGMIHIEANDPDKLYSIGDTITVVGKVKQKLLGYLYIKNATINIATEQEIIMIKEYEKIRDTKKAQDINDYKNSAQTISYENLIRRPDDYKGQVVKVTLKITQIFDNSGVLGFLYEKGYAGTQSGNEWVIKYELPENASRIIDGDTVTFYGEFNGLQERTRAFGGSKVYIPHLIAKYHVIN